MGREGVDYVSMNERWHEKIRSKPGEFDDKSIWVCEPEKLASRPEIALRYVSAKDSQDVRVPDGVYVETNVREGAYNAIAELRSLINTQITLDLMENSNAPAVSSGPELDLGNAIRVTQFAVNSLGAVILSVSPVLPSE